MARKFFKYPPRPSSGAGTFSDDIVGLQLVTGGGLTQANFEFTVSVTEKVNRQFLIGAFSDPISLDTLKINSVLESKEIIARDFRVYPNFDLSEISKFTLFGPLTKRMESSVQKIIHFFPAAIEISQSRFDATTGLTAFNCVYNNLENTTSFDVNIKYINNPFGIDFSVNSDRNISLLEYQVSPLRNLTDNYSKYSLFINGEQYPLTYLEPSNSLFSGNLNITVAGNPFSGNNNSIDYLIIRPNDFYADKSFIEPFDEVEKFLLNRLVTPIFTATFQVPKQTDDGLIYIENQTVTWPLNGRWNIDIETLSFKAYISQISQIAALFDENRTNLIVRFLTTQSFKDFDTSDQRIQKVLSIYGRSFDDIKKFIDTLSFMNSVNYTVKNDIPSQLLSNLAQTLGWRTNISPITNDDFLQSVFGNDSKIQYPGYARANTPTELNYQYYRNLILNAAYLFKAKGTRKSIEFLLRLVGAPDALVEFNENIYVAGQKINMGEFENQYRVISFGSYVQNLPVYEQNNVFSVLGTDFTAYTSQRVVADADAVRGDYPVDDEGYPSSVQDSPSYFFQKGAGWFELVKDHQSPQEVNVTNSIFTGQNFDIQTVFEPFSYGQKYLERYRKFPYMSLGFSLTKITDNKKSWVYYQDGLRRGTNGSGYNAYYYIADENYVVNVKNVELFLNPAQALLYDVWYMSNQYGYPIPNTPLTSPYPRPGGVDWTLINPQPSKKSFFEFAQTFWLNMINVRNRQTSSDGKTGGYPTLSSIWWNYLDSQQNVGIPNDNFNYQNMIAYIEGLGDYWIRLVEQMMPATTLWMTGTKYENSIFHRQKFVYRLQRGCRICPIPCDPCQIFGNIFPYTCTDEELTCELYPGSNPDVAISSFKEILYQQYLDYLDYYGLTYDDCCNSTIISKWYVNANFDNVELVNQFFYTGYGLNDVPTPEAWKYWVENNLEDPLNKLALGVTFGDTTFTIFNLGCDPIFKDKIFELNVGIELEIDCVASATTTTTTVIDCKCYEIQSFFDVTGVDLTYTNCQTLIQTVLPLTGVVNFKICSLFEPTYCPDTNPAISITQVALCSNKACCDDIPPPPVEVTTTSTTLQPICRTVCIQNYNSQNLAIVVTYKDCIDGTIKQTPPISNCYLIQDFDNAIPNALTVTWATPQSGLGPQLGNGTTGDYTIQTNACYKRFTIRECQDNCGTDPNTGDATCLCISPGPGFSVYAGGCNSLTMQEGIILYTDSSLTTPYIGSYPPLTYFMVLGGNQIFFIDSATPGEVNEDCVLNGGC